MADRKLCPHKVTYGDQQCYEDKCQLWWKCKQPTPAPEPPASCPEKPENSTLPVTAEKLDDLFLDHGWYSNDKYRRGAVIEAILKAFPALGQGNQSELAEPLETLLEGPQVKFPPKATRPLTATPMKVTREQWERLRQSVNTHELDGMDCVRVWLKAEFGMEVSND